MKLAHQAGAVAVMAALATLFAVGYAHAGTGSGGGGAIPLPSPTLTLPVTTPSLPVGLAPSASPSPSPTLGSTSPTPAPSVEPTVKTSKAAPSHQVAVARTVRLPGTPALARALAPTSAAVAPALPVLAGLVIPDVGRLLPAVLYASGQTGPGLPPVIASAGGPTALGSAPAAGAGLGVRLAAGTAPARSDLPILITFLLGIAAATVGGQRALAYISRL